MRNLICKAAAACALFGLSASSVLAGDWEVWTQKQGGDRLTIVASFAGDGVTEEAHLDLKVNGSFEVIDSQTLLKGSVCVASAEKNIIRAVPPSGAGSALKSASTEACMFTIRINEAKGWSAEQIVSVGFKECASSVKGDVPCEATIRVLK